MTTKKELEARLAQYSDRAELVVTEGKVVHYNPAAARILGYDNLNGLELKAFYPNQPEPGERILTNVVKCDGSRLDVDVYSIKDPEGNLLLYISDAPVKATRDPLTGLLGRAILEELITQDKAVKKRYSKHFLKQYGDKIGFLMIDMDNFRDINNTYGHAKGDEVLRGVAKLLKNSTRESDMVIRYGGDEFMVIMPFTEPEQGTIVLERIKQKLMEWNAQGTGIPLGVSFSIGDSYWDTGNGRTLGQVVEEADKKMYEAKKSR